MEPLTTLTAVAAPLLRANVDTDAIIPSREMRTVSKSGLADGLFAGWRYLSIGSRDPDPAFVLNQPAFAGARILVGGDNFGCGSSREHAVWALREYGFRAVIAPSFNPIFRNNCVRNGVAPVVLSPEAVERLAETLADDARRGPVTVDVSNQTVVGPDGFVARFELDSESREMLLHGLDAIELTRRSTPAIDAFTTRDRLLRPWVYF
ncbi:MAG: 3-isopropylmalate dehydratase small subunit [Pseudomonadota bacterium]